MKTPKSILLTVAAGMLLTLGVGNAATTSYDIAKSSASNGFVAADPDLRVGQGGSAAVRFATFAAFSVQDILTDTGLTIGDLASTDFTFSFNTTNNTDLVDGTFKVGYVGFYANADTAPTSFWTGLRTTFTEAGALDTGVTDTLANQTGITSPTFTLTGVSEANSANDYIVVGIGYSNVQANNVRELVSGMTLNGPDPVPEPSAALLGGLGLLILLRRRRA